MQISPKKSGHSPFNERFRARVDNIDSKGRVIASETKTDHFLNILDAIHKRYGRNTDYIITDLATETLVSKAETYRQGPPKDVLDKDHFSKRMEIFRRIHRLKESGSTHDEIATTLSNLGARSYILKLCNMTEFEFIKLMRFTYSNDALGADPQPDPNL